MGDAPHFAARMAVIFGESQNTGQTPKEPALRGKEDNAPASQNPALGSDVARVPIWLGSDAREQYGLILITLN